MRYNHDRNTIGLPLGTVDEDTIRDDKVKDALRPASHIFASQNPWWHDINNDRLPTRERFGGDYEERINAWVERDSRRDTVSGAEF